MPLFTRVRGRLQRVEKLPSCPLSPHIGHQIRRFWGCSSPILGRNEFGADFFNTLANSANFSLLDFSHLSQAGGGRSRPMRSKRGHFKAPTTRPAFPIWTNRARSGPLKGATPRLLARSAGSISHPFGTVSCTPPPPPPRAHERRRFRPVKASETICVLAAYTDP